jgi:RNA polymerase sigma factor (sigma-70 family)
LRAGDGTARVEHFGCANVHLTVLARRMLHGYPALGIRVEADDIRQDAELRLWFVLREARPATFPEFMALAAIQVRRALIDASRYHFGRSGAGKRRPTARCGHNAPVEPADSEQDFEKLAWWPAFHHAVGALPDDERHVANLHWYHALTHAQTADLLEVSLKTVKRRWNRARALLRQAFKD